MSDSPDVRETTAHDPRPDPRLPLVTQQAWRDDGLAIDAEMDRAAERFPDHVAVRSAGGTTRYRELAQMCTRAAAVITRQTAACPDRPVVIVARRSLALLVAILAAVRAGRTFAVLDAQYPVQRLLQQAAVVTPGFIIGAGLAAAELDDIFPADGTAGRWILEPGSLPPAVEAAPARAQPAEAAYLLFTSGTTGTPKCIRTGHAPLRHFVDFYRDTFGPGPQDRFSLLSGLGHDPLLRDIFVPLSCGATVCVPEESVIRSPADLWQWLTDEQVSHVHCTPQLIRLVVAGRRDGDQIQSLRWVFSGGDMLSSEHVGALRAVAPAVEVVNFYGSSETPQAMAFHRVGDLALDNPIPLGTGIRDVQLLVLREDLSLARVGEPGQIGIRTHFLSDGYLGDQAATAHQYIVSPFSGASADRIYLTGDQGVYRSDGAVLGRGRVDDQVKIRGFRVELAEVSRAIEATAMVKNFALLAHTGPSGEKQLVAFLVAPDGSEQNRDLIEALRTALGDLLPAYMVPFRWIFVDSIPLTPNRKVDRVALVAILRSCQEQAGLSLRADTGLDPRIRRIIVEIEDAVGCQVDRLDRSFVDWGGDSLSYIRVSLVLEDELGSLPAQWEKRPLEDFVDLLPESSDSGARPPAVRIEFALLLRCLSIIMVVANHAMDGMAFAATSALFVASGINFSRFLVPAVLTEGRLDPVLKFVMRFAIPAGLWQILRSIWMHNWWLPNLFLFGTFFQNPARPVYTFWYLDVLAANLLLLSGLTWLFRGRLTDLNPSSGSARMSRYAFATLLVGVGLAMAAAQVILGWWDGELGRDSVAPFKWFWLLALGWLVAESDTTVRRLITTGVTLVIGLGAHVLGAAVQVIGPMVDALLVLAVLALIWKPHITIARILHRPIVEIASATLFIYITNYTVLYHLLPMLDAPRNLVLEVGMALLIGYAAAKAWERLTVWVRKQWSA